MSDIIAFARASSAMQAELVYEMVLEMWAELNPGEKGRAGLRERVMALRDGLLKNLPPIQSGPMAYLATPLKEATEEVLKTVDKVYDLKAVQPREKP